MSGKSDLLERPFNSLNFDNLSMYNPLPVTGSSYKTKEGPLRSTLSYAGVPSNLKASNFTQYPEIVYEMKGPFPERPQETDLTATIQDELSTYLELILQLNDSSEANNGTQKRRIGDRGAAAPELPERHPKHTFYPGLHDSEESLDRSYPPSKKMRTKATTQQNIKNEKPSMQRVNSLILEKNDFASGDMGIANSEVNDNMSATLFKTKGRVIDLPSVESPWKIWADAQLAQWGKHIDQTLGNDELNLELTPNNSESSDSSDFSYKQSTSSDDIDQMQLGRKGTRDTTTGGRFSGLFSGAIKKLNVVKNRGPRRTHSGYYHDESESSNISDTDNDTTISASNDPILLGVYSNGAAEQYKNLHGDALYKMIDETIMNTRHSETEGESTRSQAVTDNSDVHSARTTTSVFTTVRDKIRKLKRRSSSTLQFFHRSNNYEQSIVSFSNDPSPSARGRQHSYMGRKLFSRSSVQL